MSKKTKPMVKEKVFKLIHSIYLANNSFCELSFFSSGKMYNEYREYYSKKNTKKLENTLFGSQFNGDFQALTNIRMVSFI